jgi:hypothetical protein
MSPAVVECESHSPHHSFLKITEFYPSFEFVDPLWITSVCCVYLIYMIQGGIRIFQDNTMYVFSFHGCNVGSHSTGIDVHLTYSDSS